MTLLKKCMAIGLSVALVVSVVACGPGGDEPPASAGGGDQQQSDPGGTDSGGTDPAPAGEAVTLTYARGMDSTDGTVRVMEAFNAQADGITVNYVEMPADTGAQHDAYVTVFSAGGTEYDVFDADVIWPPEFAQAGYALPLDAYIERDGINLGDYMDGPVDALTFQGRMWGMPKFIDAGLLFYRTDIVDKAPETWDELISMAAEYKGAEGTTSGFVFQARQYEGLICNAIEYITAYGGEVVDGNGDIVIGNSPEVVAGLEKFMEIVGSDFVPNNVTTMAEPESHTYFLEGKSVFIRNWPYQWGLAADPDQSRIAGNVGVAPLPSGSVRSAAALGGWVSMINRHSENPDAAWEFIKFMTGSEGQKISAIEGSLAPTLVALYDDPEIIAANPLFGNEDFAAGLQAAVPRPVSPIYPELSDIMQIEISKAIAGEITAEAAVQAMHEKMSAAVEAAR